MKAAFLFCSLSLPLVAQAQQPAYSKQAITYHVGLKKAPLYKIGGDTIGNPSFLVPSQEEVEVVGKYAYFPQWVVVKREGFTYITPARSLSDYDPDDAAPLPIDPQNQLITYQGVVEVPGVSKADLYTRALGWVAQAYKPEDNVLKQQNQADGELVIQGVQPAVVYRPYDGVLRSSYAGVVRHTLTIYIKDGRYKYVLSNLTHDAVGTLNMRSGGPLEQSKTNLFGYIGMSSQKPWTEMKVAATRNVRHLLDSLQAAMTQQPVKKAAKNPRDF